MAGITEFNDNVEEYEQWFMDNPFAYISELHAVRDMIPPGRNGVEIGTGTGRFAGPLGIAKGVEPSTSMAAVARKKGIDVVSGVAERLPFKDAEFDFALMVMTICFLDDIGLAFAEVRRVVKPGGSLIIGFLDSNSKLGKDYLKRKDESVFYRNAKFYSVEEITSFLIQSGFGDFEFRQTIFLPLNQLAGPEPVKNGHGQGSFVVIRAMRK